MTLRPIWGRNHTIWVADDLWVAADQKARHEGAAIYDVVDSALRKFLDLPKELSEEAERVAREQGPKKASPAKPEEERISARQKQLLVKKYGKDSPMVKALDG